MTLTIHTDRHPVLADTAATADRLKVRGTVQPSDVRPVADWTPTDRFTDAYLAAHGYGPDGQTDDERSQCDAWGRSQTADEWEMQDAANRGRLYADAREARVTTRDRWARSQSPYGACLDPYGEVIYGMTRHNAAVAGHPVTVIYPAGHAYIAVQYTPLDERTMQRRTNRPVGRPPVNGKAMTAAERKRRQRARQRAEREAQDTTRTQQSAPVTVQSLSGTGLLESIDWMADI